MSEEKVSGKKLNLQPSSNSNLAGYQNNQVPSPPDSKRQAAEFAKKLDFKVDVAPFDKYILEPFNLTEPQFWSFMKNYMENKIDQKQLLSFYDYELLMKN